MAKMGAPKGNTNAQRGRQFSAMLDSLLSGEGGRLKLRGAVQKLLDAAEAGEPWALQMLADRLDGRAAQTVDQNVSVSGTVEHVGVQEASRRIAELLGAAAQGDQPPSMPH